MSRENIINELKKYFSIEELVGRDEYERDGELCWRYLRTELLHTVLIIRRDILRVPMVVNTWRSGGRFDERGFRSNISEIVKGKTSAGKLYISAHTLGAAIDFDAEGMSADQARMKIAVSSDLLPYPIRLEKGVNWVHVDTYDSLSEGKKVSYF